MTNNDASSRFPLLPTLLTLANGVCGLASISLATSDAAQGGDARTIFWAGNLLFIGMLFDMLDGQVARLTKQTSRFGVELDSLCDMISFGVAPVFLLFACTDVQHDGLLWCIGALFAACAALRLARFNVEQGKEHSSTFRGLPTPAAAGTVAAFAIAYKKLDDFSNATSPEGLETLGVLVADITPIALPVLMLALALLMVSRIQYPHVLDQFFKGQRSLSQVVQLLFAIAAVCVVHQLAVPLIFCAFVLAPPANLAVVNVARRWQEAYAR